MFHNQYYEPWKEGRTAVQCKTCIHKFNDYLEEIKSLASKKYVHVKYMQQFTVKKKPEFEMMMLKD